MPVTLIAAWDRTLQALRRILVGETSTTELPARERLRFFGAGVDVADNEDANSIDVEIPGVLAGGGLTDVTATTPIAVTTPGAGVRNVAISATPSFTSISATSHYQVGAGTKRYQDATPSAAGHVSTDANGRLQVYVGGAARKVPTIADLPIVLTFRKNGVDAAPADATLEQALIGGVAFPFPLTIASAKLVLDNDAAAPIALSDTNFASFEIGSYQGAGIVTHVNVNTTATGGDSIGALAALAPLSLPIANPSVAAGALFTGAVSKTAAGATVGGFTLQLICYAALP